MARRPVFRLTPQRIVTHLDRYVAGHARAKRDLALCAWRQWLTREHGAARSPRTDPNARPQTALLIGPTGCGKTHLLRTLARFFRGDLLYFSAASLVQTGYVGMSVDRMIQEIFLRCGSDIRRAERAIVLIDEIDKLRKSDASGPDVSGSGVQEGLLTVLDGRPANIRGQAGGPRMLDTSGMLFVCAGAFVGLDEIAAARGRGSGRRRVGFSSAEPPRDAPEHQAPVMTQDLVEYGMLPELIGRFSVVSRLEPLSAPDLVRVMRDVEDSALTQKQKVFDVLGVSLRFEERALALLAAEAVSLGIGARGLARVLNEVLAPEEFDLPLMAERGVTELIVTEAAARRRGRAVRVQPGRADSDGSPRTRSRQGVLMLGDEGAMVEGRRATAPARSRATRRK